MTVQNQPNDAERPPKKKKGGKEKKTWQQKAAERLAKASKQGRGS